MRLALKAHPDFPSDLVSGIEVDIERAAEVMILRYVLTGAIAGLAVPRRTDELWRHTCFEAFLQPEPGSAYVELNFAPSTQWAAYRFTGYRKGMTPADFAAPRIEDRKSTR